MVTTNRWNIDNAEVPARIGVIHDVSQFDCGAFSVHANSADIMGPLPRNFIETVYEALYDAGVNPAELEGTKTAVFAPCLKTDCQEEMAKFDVGVPKKSYAEIHRVTAANYISYLLKINGPSTYVDTGCSSSFYSVEEAYRAIRNGLADAAIVGGALLNLHPSGTAECAREGFLGKDGRCKAFDNRANGYVKSEAISTIFLQKRKDARRVYCEIKHCKISCDGFKEEGIGCPSTVEQKNLFSRVYEESGVNPAEVGFVESHGTGTIVGDLQESTAIDKAIVKQGSLLVGSVKSNMGHAEQMAGMCEIAKAVIVMETGLIPPNLHHQQPRQDIEPLRVGRIKIPTEITPFPKNSYLAVNSFGFGGTNAHLLLKANSKVKNEDNGNYPRLVCVSGRTQDTIEALLNDLTSKPPNLDLFALLNDLNKLDIPQNRYRGTAIFNNGEICTTINKIDFSKKDVCLVLGDYSKSLLNMGLDLTELPFGQETWARVTKILQCNFRKLLTETDNQRLISSLIQIVIVHILSSLGANVKVIAVSPHGIFAEAYSKKILSFEETVFFASLTAETDRKDSDNVSINDIKRYLCDSGEKSVAFKAVFHYLVKNHKPKDVPIGEDFVMLTIGRVDDVEEEKSFLLALSRYVVKSNIMNVPVKRR